MALATGRRGALWAIAALLAVPACAKDIVLPDEVREDVCGDGVLGPTEECDTSGPGCAACKITPGYTCDDDGCYVPCGDGIVGDGARCDGAHKVDDCDMTGYWVSRETDFSRDTILNAVQTSSTWYAYHFTQTGDVFQVDQMLQCGLHVSGSANVDYTPGSYRGLIYANDQSPKGAHGPRKGTFKAQGGGCGFTFDRWYTVFGVTADFVPPDFSQKPDLSSLPPLPYEDDPVNPHGDHLQGADDPDGDGFVGYAVHIGGITPGTREAAHRDFKEYFTGGDAPVPQQAIQFSVNGAFDLQENVLSVHDCSSWCSLVKTSAVPDHTLTPRVTLRFLGKTLTSPSVRAVFAGNPGDDLTTDLATCANARLALPHDPSKS